MKARGATVGGSVGYDRDPVPRPTYEPRTFWINPRINYDFSKIWRKMGWVSLGTSALKTDLKPPMFVLSWNAFWTSYLPANFGEKKLWRETRRVPGKHEKNVKIYKKKSDKIG